MADKKMVFPVITGVEELLPYYTAGVGIDYEQESVSRPGGCAQYQWVQCREGRGELLIGEKRFEVGPGQGMLFFPGEPHSYHSIKDWKTDWIIFEGRDIGRFFTNTMKAASSGVYYISAPARLAERIWDLYYAASGSPAQPTLCSALVYEALLAIVTLTSSAESASLDDKFKRLEPVMAYINENFSRPVTLQELAEIADVTPQYLCMLFKAFTSRTVFEYINMTRIRHSKELLMGSPKMSVKLAAALSGFSDVSYFCTMFRRFEGMSPREFSNS